MSKYGYKDTFRYVLYNEIFKKQIIKASCNGLLFMQIKKTCATRTRSSTTSLKPKVSDNHCKHEAFAFGLNIL